MGKQSERGCLPPVSGPSGLSFVGTMRRRSSEPNPSITEEEPMAKGTIRRQFIEVLALRKVPDWISDERERSRPEEGSGGGEIAKKAKSGNFEFAA